MDELVLYSEFVDDLIDKGDNNFNEFVKKHEYDHNIYNGRMYCKVQIEGLVIEEGQILRNVKQLDADTFTQLIKVRIMGNQKLIDYYHNDIKKKDRVGKINKILNGV